MIETTAKRGGDLYFLYIPYVPQDMHWVLAAKHNNMSKIQRNQTRIIAENLCMLCTILSYFSDMSMINFLMWRILNPQIYYFDPYPSFDVIGIIFRDMTISKHCIR